MRLPGEANVALDGKPVPYWYGAAGGWNPPGGWGAPNPPGGWGAPNWLGGCGAPGVGGGAWE